MQARRRNAFAKRFQFVFILYETGAFYKPLWIFLCCRGRRRKQSFLLRTFCKDDLQGSPCETLLRAYSAQARTRTFCKAAPFMVRAGEGNKVSFSELSAKTICRVAPRPCTPGSISYREEMDERRARNLLVP